MKDTLDEQARNGATHVTDAAGYGSEHGSAAGSAHGLRSREYRQRAIDQYIWVGGTILIVIGGLLLLQNMGVATGLRNWWALFLFIPAVVTGIAAYSAYQEKGYLDRAAWGAFTGALVPLVIGVFFLFGLNWSVFWPLILIAVGVIALMNGMIGNHG